VPEDTRYAHLTRRRFFVLVIATTLLVLLGQGLAHASTAAIDKAQSEARALMELIDQLDRGLSAATEDYNYANQQLKDSQAAAKKLSGELKQAEADLASSHEQFNQRVVAIYKSGQVDVLSLLMDASSFSELLNQLDQLTIIGEQDSKLIDQISTYKTQTAEQKTKLDAELRQQKIYAEQAAVARQTVLDQLAKQTKALKGKEAQIAQLRKEEAARQAKLAEEERARQAFLSSRPGKVIKYAMQYLGVPYVWGGASPKGFDCSGLVQYVYAKVGISLPHSSRMQYSYGKPVSRSELKPGDLVFYYSPIQHVGIYLGNGRMINATGNHVQINDAFQRSYQGARRVF